MVDSRSGLSSERDVRIQGSRVLNEFRYQSFDGDPGMVDSKAKLVSLRLPPLYGKRILDIGCNEGFYCDAAQQNGAAEVIGIDSSQNAITSARRRFPSIEFRVNDWSKLPEGKFDVIFLLSIIHYASSESVLQSILINVGQHLTFGGLLVLETGTAVDDDDPFEVITREDGSTVSFPSQATLFTLLKKAGLAMRLVGNSIYADGRSRVVYHCRPLQTQVLFITGSPGSGKTYLADALGSPAVSLDLVTRETIDKFPALQEVWSRSIPITREVQRLSGVTPEAFEDAFAQSLKSHIRKLPPAATLIVEGWAPESTLNHCIDTLRKLQYRTWHVTLDSNGNEIVTTIGQSDRFDGAMRYRPADQGGVPGVPIESVDVLESQFTISIPCSRLVAGVRRAVVVLRRSDNPTDPFVFRTVSAIREFEALWELAFDIPESSTEFEIVDLFLINGEWEAVTVNFTLLEKAHSQFSEGIERGGAVISKSN